MIERAIDYIQAALSLSESTIIMKGFKPLPPVRFYKRGYQHPNGFRLYFGNPNSPKAMAIASGETMQSLRNDEKLDAEIVDWILSAGGEISRLDLAVTEFIEEDLIQLEDVRSWYSQGLMESQLAEYGCKTIASVLKEGGEELQTIYVGDIAKRGKRGIFRAYDKGIELGIGSEIVTRIELELKRDKADKAARRIAETNDIAGNFRAYFNVRSKDFERVMDADAVKTHRGKNLVKQAESEETARRWDWLLNQVAPALKQAISEERKQGRGDARLIAFMEASGLLKDAREIASHLADTKYRDKLLSNELVERSRSEKD